jgi:hypothetical protein
MANIRHKVFISYHHADQEDANDFINTFDEERNVFIARALGTEMSQDIINSDDVAYVMRRIRDLYLRDSTVTVVLIGRCTWARRYVDWELQSSLRHGDTVRANGVLGIKLRSSYSAYPTRLLKNLDQSNGDSYARVIEYPQRKDVLSNCIDDAYNARWNRVGLIVNPRDRFSYNKSCP